MTKPVSVAFSVDALSPQLTGIGRYCLELGRGLRKAAGIEHLSYFLGNHWLNDPEALLDEGWRLPGGRLRRRLIDWRGRMQARGAIVHGPNYFLPNWAETGIVTVHDLSVLLYPDTHPVERVRDFERRFAHTLQRASAVITDSETVRREVTKVLGVPGERVFAVPLGLKPARRDQAEISHVLSQLDLKPGGYTLCVSTFEPRKRIDRLIEAYAALAPAVQRAFPLVLVGASGWRNDALNGLITAAQAAGWLKRLDFVTDATRDALYGGARLFVYPSLYEGFGLPPLEAMGAGIPTIIGDAATLIEVTQGAARIATVEDRTAFAADLAASLEDEAWRATAGAAGRRVAEGYTWDRCTAGTIDVYRQAADHQGAALTK